MPIDSRTLRSSVLSNARRGYDRSQVEAFLERCATALEHHERGRGAAAAITADDVRDVEFSLARKAPNPDQVDDLLSHVADALRAHERRAGTGWSDRATVDVVLPDGTRRPVDAVMSYTVDASGRLALALAGGGELVMKRDEWVDVRFANLGP